MKTKILRSPETTTQSNSSSDQTFLRAYYAGFLDGDGSINAQLVRRVEYRLGFQIRVSITFFQKTTRHWFLQKVASFFPGGTLRKRKDGISEYSLVGPARVSQMCASLLPFLQIKRRQALLVLEIVSRLKKDQSKQDFLALCKLVDQVGELNDSKKRTHSLDFVQSEWKKLFPVETSEFLESKIDGLRDISSGEKEYNTPTPSSQD